MELLRPPCRQSKRFKMHRNDDANQHQLEFHSGNLGASTVLSRALLLFFVFLCAGCNKNANPNSARQHTQPSEEAVRGWLVAQIAKQSEGRLELVLVKMASRQESAALKGATVAPVVFDLKVSVRAVVSCGIFLSALKQSALLRTWDLKPNSRTDEGSPIEEIPAGTTIDFDALIVALPLSDPPPLDDSSWSFMWIGKSDSGTKKQGTD